MSTNITNLLQVKLICAFCEKTNTDTHSKTRRFYRVHFKKSKKYAAVCEDCAVEHGYKSIIEAKPQAGVDNLIKGFFYPDGTPRPRRD